MTRTAERDAEAAARARSMTTKQLATYLYDRRSGCADPDCSVCSEQRIMYFALVSRIDAAERRGALDVALARGAQA